MPSVIITGVIYLITGANAYQADTETRRIFKGAETVERFDGDAMTIESLAGVLGGVSLWSTARSVLIRGLSENKLVWDKLGEWANRDASDLTLVLVEPNVDKRTKAYKALAKFTKVIQAVEWTDRSMGEAREWARQQAEKRGVRLSSRQIETIVERAMALNAAGKWVIDQYVIHHSLEALPTGEEVSDEAIDAVLPPSSFSNVFNLLDKAVLGDRIALDSALERLKRSEDAYKVFGLVASQWANVVAIKHANGRPPSQVAGDIGVSPYAMQSAAKLAPKLSNSDISAYTALLADMDMQTKSTTFDPWLALERFLYVVSADAA